MKLYVDDVREAPEGWFLVRYAERAMLMLMDEAINVEEISLDHDMGETAHDGYWLVRIMVEMNLWVPRISVHSMNPVGRANMLATLRRYAPDGTEVIG